MNIPTSPVVVLGYFLGGWDTPNPPKTKNYSPFFVEFCEFAIYSQKLATHSQFYSAG